MSVEVQHRSHVQRMSYADFERRIQDGEIIASTPVRFALLTGDEFVPAGELEMFKPLADPRRMAFRRNLTRPGVPLVTAILVGVQIRLYLWSWAPGVETWLQQHLPNWAPAVFEGGEVWRLLTYGMLHVGFTHLLFNIWFLAYTGYHLERAMGRANLLLLFFGSVFTGGALSIFLAPGRPSLGASGGDFGLLAAAVILGWKHWDSIPVRARRFYGWALAPWPVISFLLGLQAENVDNWSHLGGLIGGGVLMTFIDPDVLPGRAAINRRLRAAAWGLMLAASLAIVAWGPRMVQLRVHDESGWSVERPSYWREGWTFTGNRGWFSPTLRATVAVVTTTHEHPVTLDQAADDLVGRIGRGPRAPEPLQRERVPVHGLHGLRLALRFELSGQEQEVHALIITRGVYEYRVVFQSVAAAAERYAPLLERIEDSVTIEEVEDLERLRERARVHPRSWQPACDLGEALYRAGLPTEALGSFERALSLSPRNHRALEGLLKVHAWYHVPGGLDAAHRALQQTPDVPGVIIEAAQVLLAEDERDEAIAVLDRAWARHPDDLDLRKTRLRWGLPVDAPSVDVVPALR